MKREFLDSYEDCKSLFLGRDDGLNVLLGNGFSLAHPECNEYFSYKELAAKMKEDCEERIKSFFQLFGTSNIEAVLNRMDQVTNFYDICELCTKVIKRTVKEDHKKIKKGFIDALGAHHPDKRTDLTREYFLNGAKFIKEFDNVFTTNYDLLLYWTVMSGKLYEYFSDGFYSSHTNYVKWNPEHWGQDINFLHGALHIYRTKSHEAVKIKSKSYSRGESLLEVVQNIVETKKILPKVILEGSSEQKMSAILKSTYLKSCYENLQKSFGDLVIFGNSFEFDDHILDAIETSQIDQVFVSYYGNRLKKENIELFKKVKDKLSFFFTPGVDLFFYPAETAKIWIK